MCSLGLARWSLARRPIMEAWLFGSVPGSSLQALATPLLQLISCSWSKLRCSSRKVSYPCSQDAIACSCTQARSAQGVGWGARL
eukprot:1153475-Pelagomonas_calceolata.AAC.2